jgi:hypothetical protein
MSFLEHAVYGWRHLHFFTDEILKPSCGLVMVTSLVEEILQYNFTCLGFEVLTAVVMKSTIFWDITPRSPLSVNRRFAGTYRLHLQGRKNKLSKKPAWKQLAHYSACHLRSRWFLAQLIFWPWRWRQYIPPKLRLTLNGQHGVISPKIVLFKFYINLTLFWSYCLGGTR